jgi:Flp pilus assembly protein TadB
MVKKMRAWLSHRIYELKPDFRRDLDDAGIMDTPLEYVSESLSKSSLAAVLVFFSVSLALLQTGGEGVFWSLILSTFSFACCILYFAFKPGYLISSRSRRIESSLVFSLHALNIELESGVGFQKALSNIAESGYGGFSQEMIWVLERASKYGLDRALSDSSKRNNSKLYTRVVWQLQNSLNTGADMGLSLRGVIEDLRRKQEVEAQRYGGAMEKRMVVYVIGAIVFPALSVVVIQSVSALGLGTKISLGEIYNTVLLFSFLIQVFFLLWVTVSKPALLNDFKIESQRGGVLRFIDETLKYAGVESPRKYLAFSALSSAFLGALMSYLASHFVSAEGVFMFFFFWVSSFGWLFMRNFFEAERRGLTAAHHLPDSLRATASNISAGLTVDESLFASARDDLPVLGPEFRRVASDVMKNISFEEAISSMGERVKDSGLSMSLRLIVHGLRGGRGLSESLYHIAEILQEREHVREDVVTSINSVKTTMLLLVMFSAPLLYGFSMVSTGVMASMGEKLSADLPDEIMGLSWVSPIGFQARDYLDSFILFNLFQTSLLGCLTVGVASTGRFKEGLKYFFPTALFSVGMYVFAKNILGIVFQGMLF